MENNEAAGQRLQLFWLDYMKAIALVWIFLNHTAEQLFGSPLIANPFTGWPPLQERISQLQPLSDYGSLNAPINLLRYVGWFGDQGVQLFIIISGFGLTWGLLARQAGEPLKLWPFYRRRAERVYPLWWAAHLLVLGLVLFFPLQLGVLNSNFILSLIGIRATETSLYYLVAAWWYIGLLIQFYLIYPLLWEGLRRRGPLWLLTVGCIVAFTIRLLGLLTLDSYLDAWSRGAIFITRLPEFIFGISLAAWLYQSREKVDRHLRRRATVAAALLIYTAGMLLSLTLLGMTVAPFMLGLGALIVLYNVLGGKDTPRPRNANARFWTWVGQHSYSLYLMHHLVILLVLPRGVAPNSAQKAIRIVLAVVATLASSIALERGVQFVTTVLMKWYRRAGLVGAGIRVAAIVTALAIAAVGSELLVRQVAPQEVYGWGERPSLEPHPIFGWRLIPNQTTHLRWESYDYYVTANSLGFPGPEYAPEKSSNTLRILTVGDAFTSAEGVDTDQAWPRLLEADLAARLADREVQVLNFAITGYGPNQYEAVIAEYVPVYQPDLIVIGFYVNEYRDVLVSDDSFRASIGFDLPPQNSLRSILSLSHLKRFISLQIYEPLSELWNNAPRSHGYSLGQFASLERSQENLDEGRQRVAERLEQIRRVADGIPVILLMIPAPVQVCEPKDLSYYPRHVDLNDTATYDLELPQRITSELADTLGFGYYDLRPALRSENGICAYQPNNMHWTVTGHRLVAAYLSEKLIADGYVE